MKESTRIANNVSKEHKINDTVWSNGCSTLADDIDGILIKQLEDFEKFINEKKVDKISNNEYNITIEVVALSNLKNYISNKIDILREPEEA